jgi:long-chain-fatty-acid--[acyl-carrier-protein] ligase
MTVTTLLPLTNGIRVVHHPDPTDAGALVRKIAAYKPTLIAGTPTFIGYILDRAKPGDLDSLRLIVLGAEKPPASLFDRVKELAPAAEVIEGYGITECAPAISLTVPGANMHGTVGVPLAQVEVCVTDLESGDVLPRGSTGMLNVHGPNVFPGYIAHDGPSPFRDIDGKRWYVTGDLGTIDANSGVISFSGRLKRFLKAGGEMISLPALEEPFTRKFPPTDKGPRVAVEGIETPEGRRIVLFTTDEMTLREANAILQAEGFRGVMRLDDVKKVEALPVLGTGKTDYKVLRALIES